MILPWERSTEAFGLGSSLPGVLGGAADAPGALTCTRTNAWLARFSRGDWTPHGDETTSTPSLQLGKCQHPNSTLAGGMVRTAKVVEWQIDTK